MGRKIPERVIIYAQDVQNIMGKSPRAARRYLRQLRDIFEKEKWQFITIEEFCAASGVSEETVRLFMKDK